MTFQEQNYEGNVVVRDKALMFKHVVDDPRNRRMQGSWAISPTVFD